MNGIAEFYRSSLGKKQVMAVTGFVLFGFVLFHMFGNLKVYEGPEVYNAYARGLRTIGVPFLPESGLLWIARIVLLVCVLLHMHAAWSTTQQSRAARRVRYRQREAVQMSYAERTMRWGGVIVALFVLYHLAHFTWGLNVAPPMQFTPHQPYANFVAGFSIWWVSLIYIVANVFLGFHLYHGVWGMFQSIGWVPQNVVRNEGHDWRRTFATVFAFVVAVGNISFPLAVLAGIVR
jgi:succinate dehydrogenase / fumarate reductase cytochrome b subunit